MGRWHETKARVIHSTKTNLSRLVEPACTGQDIAIARGATPVARLVPIDREPTRRRLGAMRGRADIIPAFFEPPPTTGLDVNRTGFLGELIPREDGPMGRPQKYAPELRERAVRLVDEHADE